MRRLCLFYKVACSKLTIETLEQGVTPCSSVSIVNFEQVNAGWDIYDFIHSVRQPQRHPNTFSSFFCKTEYFKNSFFPFVIGKWNKLNPEIRSSGSCNVFRMSLLNFI